MSDSSSTTLKPKSRAGNGQTAKKRELDRIAQKKSREKARNRTLELEEKLKRLQADDKQKQIADLMRVVEDLRRENERLRGMTEKVRGLVEGVGIVRKEDSDGGKRNDASGEGVGEEMKTVRVESRSSAWRESTQEQEKAELETPGEDILLDDWWNDHSSPEDFIMTTFPEPAPSKALSHSTPSLNYDFMSFSPMTSFSTALSLGTPLLSTSLITSTSPVVPDEIKWTVSDNAFVKGIDSGRRIFHSSSSSPNHLASSGLATIEEIFNSNAAYKAILWGENRVAGERERNHPLWLALREVDERVFGDWRRKAQKVAMMFVCQRLLVYKSNPCKETLERVPSFLRPRPSQETIQHPAVIDFLIWPGLRDRLVFSHPLYTRTGDFSRAFVKNLHFHWPFPDSSILTLNPSTKQYQLSPLFEKYAFDLGSWTMDEGFFEGFREMVHDIPSTAGRGGQGGRSVGGREEGMGMEELMGKFWEDMPMSA